MLIAERHGTTFMLCILIQDLDYGTGRGVGRSDVAHSCKRSVNPDRSTRPGCLFPPRFSSIHPATDKWFELSQQDDPFSEQKPTG